IAGTDFYCQDFTTLATNMEKATTGNDKANFVFVVPVFPIESREHLFQPGGVRCNVNHVCRYITTDSFQLLNFSRISLKDLFRGFVCGNALTCRPALIVDARAR